MRLEVAALVTMNFPRYSEGAEEIGNQRFRHCRTS
jgi:hypothetical protein